MSISENKSHTSTQVERLNISFLDDAIVKARKYRDTSLHSTTAIRSSAPNSQIQDSIQRGDVIEFYGPASGGKTTILYHIALTTILPPSWNRTYGENLDSHDIIDVNATIELGGRGKGVIFFDLDGKFDIQRLYSMMIYYLHKQVEITLKEDINLIPSESEIESIAKNAIKRIHVFKPNLSESFYATLLDLPKYMRELQQNESYEFSFLMIDQINVFYWEDKDYDEVGIIANDTWKNNNIHYYIQALKQIIELTGIIVITTNWAITPPEAIDRIPINLCYPVVAHAAWQSFVKYRFVVDRQSVPQYDVCPEEGHNLKVNFLSRSLFYGRLTTPNNNPSDVDVFQFGIDEGGIVFK
ncbi:10039_t:CDS:2 [Cetraspora pellucida]|uniref:10039_t:CDS:1 n=1 Tax=Cetraspora pellucida TaxID=1433469 RepID=A0ACA9KUV2_9GLOM|nr:10039_t:CDS:2 [Cetraspora pellucida]